MGPACKWTVLALAPQSPSVTSEYFRLGLSITCFLGPTACRAKGSLPAYPLRKRQDWSRDAGRVCPLLVLAPPHPLPHLEVPFLNQVPKLEGLKGSSAQPPAMKQGSLKGRDWPKVTEQRLPRGRAVWNSGRLYKIWAQGPGSKSWLSSLNGEWEQKCLH